METIDLVDDSPVRVRTAVARAPQVVNLLDSSDSSEDDDRNTSHFVDSRFGRKRRRNGILKSHADDSEPSSKRDRANEVEVIQVKEPDGKPPAKLEDINVQQTISPTLRVLEIFPDAETRYIEEILARVGDRPDAVEAVIAYMFEHSYRKMEASKTQDGLVHVNTWMYDYMSTSSFEPSKDYISEAKQKLRADFPFLTKDGVTKLLFRSKNHYAVTHDKILSAIKGDPQPGGEEYEQYKCVDAVRKGRPLSKKQKQALLDLALASRANRVLLQRIPGKPSGVIISDPILLDETKYVTGKLDDWMDTCRQQVSREENKRIAQEQGTGMDCACCFDTYAIQDMVACREEGHLFCVDCLKSFTENQVFGIGNLGVDRETKKRSLELKCFHPDGCNSGFDREYLEKALPVKTLNKYDEIQFQVSLETAGMDDICSCPKCGFQAAVPQTQMIFFCPVVECGHESCRGCGKDPHIPLRYVFLD